MKKFTTMVMIAALTATAAGAFTGCGIGGGKDIGKEAALEAALTDAGVNESETTRLRVSSEMDDGRKVYEVQFDVEGTEYDYEISGTDGEILSVDTERISGSAGTEKEQSGSADTANAADGNVQNGGTQNGTTQNESSQNSTEASEISIEKATEIALERVPGATENDIRIQSDYDDGRHRYEGDIIYDGKEYDFEIDPATGTILEWSEERY